MKTNPDDDLYKKSTKAAVEMYGNTKNLSKSINKKLAKAEGIVGRADSEKIKRCLKILKDSAGSLTSKQSGKNIPHK
ncbi:MAG: hypothetical protein QW177_08170 [Candidatus Nitrosotenuis sp.]